MASLSKKAGTEFEIQSDFQQFNKAYFKRIPFGHQTRGVAIVCSGTMLLVKCAAVFDASLLEQPPLEPSSQNSPCLFILCLIR